MTCNCKCTCKPVSISFFWMNDNHTFVRLKGKTLDEIIKHAKKCEKNDSCGMLCTPHLLLEDGKEKRAVGKHAHGGYGDKKKWTDELAKWRIAVESDEEALHLINEGKIKK